MSPPSGGGFLRVAPSTVVCLGVALAGAPAFAAQETSPPTTAELDRRRPTHTEALHPDAEGVTGAWVGWRRLLSESLRLELTFLHDVFRVVSGGVDNELEQLRFFDAYFEADLAELADWTGATLGAEWYLRNEGELSAAVGDSQVVSNIEADRGHILAELWLEQRFEAAGARLKVGKFDANTEFAYVEHGLWFVNSSMGFSPTIFVFPTFPDPAFAVLLGVDVARSTTLRVAAFDGALARGVRTGKKGPGTFLGSPSDLFLIGELARVWDGDRPGRVGAGYWEHTGTFDRFDGGREDHARGWYLVLDQELGPLGDDAELGESVVSFLQLGGAEEELSDARLHVGAGLVVNSALRRTNDALGFGATWVQFSGEAGAGFSADGELAFELFYRRQLASWLFVQPDVQYVVNPGGDAALDDALVVGVRFDWQL